MKSFSYWFTLQIWHNNFHCHLMILWDIFYKMMPSIGEELMHTYRYSYLYKCIHIYTSTYMFVHTDVHAYYFSLLHKCSLYLTGLIKLAYLQVFVYTISYTGSKTTFFKSKLWSWRFTKFKEKNIWTQKGLKIVCHWNLHDCEKKYRFTWIIHKYIHINI